MENNSPVLVRNEPFNTSSTAECTKFGIRGEPRCTRPVKLLLRASTFSLSLKIFLIRKKIFFFFVTQSIFWLQRKNSTIGFPNSTGYTVSGARILRQFTQKTASTLDFTCQVKRTPYKIDTLYVPLTRATTNRDWEWEKWPSRSFETCFYPEIKRTVPDAGRAQAEFSIGPFPYSRLRPCA